MEESLSKEFHWARSERECGKDPEILFSFVWGNFDLTNTFAEKTSDVCLANHGFYNLYLEGTYLSFKLSRKGWILQKSRFLIQASCIGQGGTDSRSSKDLMETRHVTDQTLWHLKLKPTETIRTLNGLWRPFRDRVSSFDRGHFRK